MVYGYENCSRKIEQLTELCEDGTYKGLKWDELYQEGLSPKNEEEDVVLSLLKITEQGDIVITSTLANFSLDMNGMLITLKHFMNNGVRILSVLESFDSSSETGNALSQIINLLNLYSAICNQARRKSQAEGIDKAKKEGKYLGTKSYSPEQFDRFKTYYERYMARLLSKKDFAKKLEISRPTLDKLLRMEQERRLIRYMQEIKSKKDTQKIQMQNGYLICPSDWIYLEDLVCSPEEATDAVVIEFKNGKKFNLPHYYFFTDRNVDEKIENMAFERLKEISPEFNEALKAYPEMLNILGKNELSNYEAFEVPIPGFFFIPHNNVMIENPEIGAIVITMEEK